MNLRLFISLLGVLLLCLGTAWASEPKESKDSTEATDGKEDKEGKEGKKAEKLPAIFLEGYIPIQLRPISVLVAYPNGGQGRGTISMFLIVRGQKNVAAFCRYLPRVHAAITLTIDRTPVPVVNGRYQLKDTQRRLLEAINQFLPKPLVIKLHLLPVARIIGKGAVDLELPGTNENCMSILEIPTDVLAMLEAEKSNSAKHSVSKPAKRIKKAKNSVTLTLKPTSRKSRRKYILPSVTVEAQKTDLPAKETSEPGKCKQLNELWSEGYHQVSGRNTGWDRHSRLMTTTMMF